MPNTGQPTFICRQCPSILFVLYPFSLTNSFEWFTVWCEYPCLSKMWCDFKQSDATNVPSMIQSFFFFFLSMIGNSVASLRFTTATRKHLESSPVPSKNPLSFNSVPSMIRTSVFQPCSRQFELFTISLDCNFTCFPARHIPVDSCVGINVQLLLNLLLGQRSH